MTGALVLTGCGGSDLSSGASRDDAKAAPERQGADRAGGEYATGAKGPTAAPGGTARPPQPRAHIIRTGSVSVEAKDAQAALTAARAAAVDAGGYVGNEATRREESGRVVSELTLRVPADRFDTVLAGLEGGGRLLSRKVTAQDVTRQVVDVASRVKSQQASVIRVREMMERASALSDVVMLEGELSRRQSELEALLAQQEGLKDQTTLATITLSVSEPVKEPVREEESGPGFTDALAGGWDAFTAVLTWIVLVLGAVLPFLLTALVLLVLVRPSRRLYRRVRPARAPRGPEPSPAVSAALWPPRQEGDPVEAARPAGTAGRGAAGPAGQAPAGDPAPKPPAGD
ncbi:DUF4349 domain-containing protein [Streptomyces sp. NPDC097619]|uniref:DUF4349 domain-containing protein n=1 Tax=Streptomyces sp. NPDC097619 TaxID=3157228 RepID=UPI003325FF29